MSALASGYLLQLRQERAMRAENVKSYTETQDARLTAEQERLAALDKEIAELSAPAAVS